MNHRQLTKIHVVFAGFFLPAAITFAVTGGLYTFGFGGKYDTKSISKELALAPDPGLTELTETAKKVLAEDFQAAEPTGKAGIRRVGTSWSFEWTGTRADFSLEPTAEAGIYKVSYKKTTLHRLFSQLHKAKGGMLFKFMAGGLAIGFILLFVSGVLLALPNPKMRKWLYVSLAFGSAFYTIAAFLS